MNGERRDLLVVEDDPLVAGTLRQTFRDYGFACESCRTSAEARQRLNAGAPALCIVDLGLPDGDGLDLVREIQSRHGCGVLILTGRGFLSDRVLGLELGADDYVVKPFEPRELVARVRSILRRYGGDAGGGGPRVATFAGWRFEPVSLALHGDDGHSVTLGAAEGRLLETFLEHPNRVLTREQLVGGRDLAPDDRSIDVRVSRLRRRLGDDPHEPRLIRTVYGAGYLLATAVVWE